MLVPPINPGAYAFAVIPSFAYSIANKRHRIFWHKRERHFAKTRTCCLSQAAYGKLTCTICRAERCTCMPEGLKLVGIFDRW